MTDPADIRAWQRLSPRITTSGRLEDKDLARLADIGVRHVINLALSDHAEALADEGEKLAAQGIGYTHIPVPFDAPTQDHYARFLMALERDDAPVHVHCIMNQRVACFFYRYHRGRGMAERDARAIMAQQWVPDTIDHPAARPWADFIAQEGAA